MNRKLTITDKDEIRDFKGRLTAEEVAEMYEVSTKTIYRIWNGEDTEDDDGSYTRANKKDDGHSDISTDELVKQTIDGYNYAIERRDYYRNKSEEHPDNCAWGNLELKFSQQANTLLAIIGKWMKLEKEGISKGVDNRPVVIVDTITARHKEECRMKRIDEIVGRIRDRNFGATEKSVGDQESNDADDRKDDEPPRPENPPKDDDDEGSDNSDGNQNCYAL